MNAELLLAHFNRISDAPNAVPRLRRFVLDLAVRGKLVEQDPNDEPVAALLNRIRREKVRLIECGNARKQKPWAPLDTSEIPFLIPVSWQWSSSRRSVSSIRAIPPRMGAKPPLCRCLQSLSSMGSRAHMSSGPGEISKVVSRTLPRVTWLWQRLLLVSRMESQRSFGIWRAVSAPEQRSCMWSALSSYPPTTY